MTAPDPRLTDDTYDDGDFIVDDRLADGRATARMLGWVLIVLVGVVLAGLAAATGLLVWVESSDPGFWAAVSVVTFLAVLAETIGLIRDLHRGHR